MTNLIGQIRHAQTLTAEDAVIANLQRMGLGKPLDPPEKGNQEPRAGLGPLVEFCQQLGLELVVSKEELAGHVSAEGAMAKGKALAKAGRLTAHEETELLDWVSACQSAYHLENTPGHRFGGLPGALVENRAALVEYVNDLLALRAPSATPVRTSVPIEGAGTQVDYLPQG